MESKIFSLENKVSEVPVIGLYVQATLKVILKTRNLLQFS